jgi:hypothetical protein
MHILKKALIFSVLICSLGLNAHSAVDDPTFPCDHLRSIFSPQGYSNLAYHTSDEMDTNELTAHVLVLKIDSPTPIMLDQKEGLNTTILLAHAHHLVESQPYFKLSHIVSQLISYHKDPLYDSAAQPIVKRYLTDWLRSASLHADVPDAIKGRILTAIGPVPVVGSPASSAAD